MSDEPGGPESSVAIELSRRKTAPPGDRARAHLGVPLAVVRAPIAGARRAAAPYVTMTRIAVARLGRDRLARAGGLLLAVVAMIAIFADLLASDLPLACRWRGVVYLLPNVTHPAELTGADAASMSRARRPGDWIVATPVAHGPRTSEGSAAALLAPLSPGHPFGTDASGRDVFAGIVHGARTALGLGLVAAMVLVIIGVALGAASGFAGGIVDGVVSRLVESLTAIPTLLLVLVVGALVPRPTTVTLLATIALTRWTELARLVRAEVLLALRTDYVTAARALGASAGRVLFRHVLPNAIAPAIVAAAFALSWVVLVEATVDFLRAGGPARALETSASWGTVLGDARANPRAWWLVAFPGAALLVTLCALNLVGEAARNALDPRLRGDGA